MASFTARRRLITMAVIITLIGAAGFAVWVAMRPGHEPATQPYVLLSGRKLNCNAASARETCDLEADVRYTGPIRNPRTVLLQGYYDGANGRGVLYCNAPTHDMKPQERATVRCRITAPDDSSYISPRLPDLAGPNAPTV